MKIQCCSCKKWLGEKPGGEPGDVTHTYCPECYKRELAKIRAIKTVKIEAKLPEEFGRRAE